jgi:polyisoprenyl-phosphate glycosyltransferase
LSRNFGHQIALTAGLQHATGKAVISMDCDMQDPPELILEMINKWKKGNQIVYARRKNFRKDSQIKKIGSKIYYSILKRFAEVEIPRNVGDFRLVDEKVLKELNTMREKSRYLRGMVAWIGYRHEFVDYFRPDRSRGTSGYSLEKLIKLGMDGFFNFTFFPLKFGMYLGLISIFVGIVFLIYMVTDIIINDVYYYLYKFLVVILFIFMGFLFILFWLIGEYIARIYDEVRDRPLYVIREKGNFE